METGRSMMRWWSGRGAFAALVSLTALVLLPPQHAEAVGNSDAVGSADRAAIRSIQRRSNVDPDFVERLTVGDASVDVEVVVKAYDVNPLFYRPVVDDTAAMRRRAMTRLREGLTLGCANDSTRPRHRWIAACSVDDSAPSTSTPYRDPGLCMGLRLYGRISCRQRLQCRRSFRRSG